MRRFEIRDARSTHRLTSITDRKGNRIELRYEGEQLREVLDSAGRTIRVGSTADGRIASLASSNAVSQGRWVTLATYTYDEHENLASVTDADGFVARYGYDDEHRLTFDADRAGLAFRFVYGRDGRCIESWGEYPGRQDQSLVADVPRTLADGVTRVKGIHHCKFEYHPGGYSEVVDSTQVRRFFGNRHGTLDKRIEGGGVVTATYRDDGFLMSRTDALGATTTYERDPRGRIVKIVDALGRVTAIQRDGGGQPIRIVDPAGGVTEIDRDTWGNPLRVKDAAGGVVSQRFDGRGLLVESISPIGGKTTREYDVHGNVVTIVEPSGGVWRFAYDAFGRMLTKTDPLGAVTQYTYTPRGDLAARRDALGGVTRYSYDGEGRVVQEVDPKGAVTSITWGGYHKLCQRIDPNERVVTLKYNLEGELVEVHNERGEVHRRSYTASGELVGETTFDGRAFRYVKDLAGQLVRLHGPTGGITEYAYDAVGQLVAREFPDGTSESYTYNERGEIVAVRSDSGVFEFERNAVGCIVREVQSVGGASHWVDTSYDAAGNRTLRRTSLGHEEAVTRGGNGERLRTVFDASNGVDHRCNLLGRETARQLSRGGWIESTFDALGHLARRRAGARPASPTATQPDEPEWLGTRGGVAAVDTAYRYGWDGELIEALDAARGATEYTYDPVGQLVASRRARRRPELFFYDATGNVHEAPPAPPRRYGSGDRLLEKGSTSYRWDAADRLVEKIVRADDGRAEVTRYRWTASGLLRAVERSDGTTIEYAYDPFARRTQKRITKPRRDAERTVASITRFVWDGEVLVHEIKRTGTDSGDAVTEERTYAFEDRGFSPIAERSLRRDAGGVRDTGWLHHVNDPSGTPERLLDASGGVVSERTHTAWGVTDGGPSDVETSLRFAGQQEDESGLFYNRFRYYDPDAGRYISADPLGIHEDTNVFAYGRNPVGWIDPFGLGPSNDSGKAGEAALNRLFPQGDTQTTFPMRGRPDRRVDNYDPTTNTAREAKAGRICLDSRIQSEIERDKLLKRRGVNVEWHFFRSPVTGEIGPTAQLRQELDRAGIPVVEHPRSQT